MLRSPPRPTLGWGRPIAAVLAGVIVPAIPAAVYLVLAEVDRNAAIEGWAAITWIGWLMAACLTASPLFVWIALPLAVPAVLFAARYGWAGPLSLVGISVGLGLPIAHIFLNGDLTTEAPEMIPFLVTAFAVQAICGWVILRDPKVRSATVADATSA